MVNRRISKDLKDCALTLWDHGWEVEDICEVLGVSRASCFRWRNLFEELGTVARPPSPLVGRTRIITRALMMAVEDLFAEESDLFLDEVCTWLAVEHDITISSSSLSRNLKQVGLSRKMLQKIASERDDVRREEFKNSLRNDFVGDGSEFVVLDETSKNERTYARHYGRSHYGQRAQLCDVFVRGDRYSLCAAMTIDGYLATRVVEGSFDAQEFYDFVLEDVLPHMNPYPEERSVLVLDNCRIHHNQELVDLVESAGCIILYLPPYSPDLTPIEESFSALKAYIRRHGDKLRRYEDPVEALYEATGCITAENAYAWFKNAGYIVT